MEIRTRRSKGVCIVECGGDLMLGAGETALRNTVVEALDKGERFLVLNFLGLRYIDSAGVGETIACAKRAFERNGVIKIVLPEEGAVRKVFSITCLDRAFELFHDEAQAVASFSG